ncbi:E3 ubiquitin-protein ligase ATL42 [Sesamum alatum]|uniref:RING-type E3 ubiquitin transferase n=1 Tax=Sesamum alatum TaxID=300844 RepID=A0AAE1XQ56_9LAMI|nr:E3 ubiquitin-protein ligase ATL42 [Sesamum alatum]
MITSFLLLQFIIIFFIDVKAQNPSETTEVMPPQDDSVSNNFQPSLAVVIGMLSIMFALTFILILYAKFCHRGSSSSSSVYNATGQQIQDGLLRSRSCASGLDKTVVESLPFFRFSSLKGSRDGLECSVCLAKYEEVEILRLLPKCRHAFHIGCIDQWLEKHSTCPLCRRKLSADDLTCSTSLRFLWSQTEARSESNLELYVERQESRYGSSRFSIGSSFRKADRGSNKQEELPIQQAMDSDDENHDKQPPLHRFNHKINVVSDVVLKHRWSNVSSSDLMFLNSEMLNDLSSARFSCLDEEIRDDDGIMNVKQEMGRKREFESKMMEIRQARQDNNSFPFPTSSDSKQFANSGFGSKALNPNEKRSMSEIIVHPRFSTELARGEDSCVDLREERTRRLWLPIARKTVQWFANRERRAPQSQESNLKNLNV